MKITTRILRAINEGISSALNKDYEDDLNLFDPDHETTTNKDAKVLFNTLAKRIQNYNKTRVDNSIYLLVVQLHNHHGFTYKVFTYSELNSIVKYSIKIAGNRCNLNWIDTSNITYMNGLFSDKQNFNGDISDWDVSNVELMQDMFKGCKLFNCDISNWNTEKLISSRNMFNSAESFNLPIGKWNTSNLQYCDYMFNNTTFNLPLNDWDTSKLKLAPGMFRNAELFNYPLNKWDLANIENMQDMFNGAASFNLDISNWDITHVDKHNKIDMFDDCPIKDKYKPNGLYERN